MRFRMKYYEGHSARYFIPQSLHDRFDDRLIACGFEAFEDFTAKDRKSARKSAEKRISKWNYAERKKETTRFFRLVSLTVLKEYVFMVEDRHPKSFKATSDKEAKKTAREILGGAPKGMLLKENGHSGKDLYRVVRFVEIATIKPKKKE